MNCCVVVYIFILPGFWLQSKVQNVFDSTPTAIHELAAGHAMQGRLTPTQRTARRAPVHVYRRSHQIADRPAHVPYLVHVFDALQAHDVPAFQNDASRRGLEANGAVVQLLLSAIQGEPREPHAAAKGEFVLVSIVPFSEAGARALVATLDRFANARLVQHRESVHDIRMAGSRIAGIARGFQERARKHGPAAHEALAERTRGARGDEHALDASHVIGESLDHRRVRVSRRLLGDLFPGPVVDARILKLLGEVVHVALPLFAVFHVLCLRHPNSDVLFWSGLGFRGLGF